MKNKEGRKLRKEQRRKEESDSATQSLFTVNEANPGFDKDKVRSPSARLYIMKL